MKQQLRPNRNITMGDRGERAIKTEFTKREKNEATRQSIDSIKVRMKDWSDSFVLKIYRENSHPHWRAAADETMKERGTSPKTTLTRKQMVPKPKKKEVEAIPEKEEARHT